ncbi:helix-turn-helix domain-containing protein [Limosilactobacillus vaginalis]|uniref:helix-turn-helix domain-containing protein n=1 Tax=Limosilactobacillus vaginalis TaxID=1633 RepID=UPI0025A3C38D|nr:helix-turn-helix transcriptional regulator [Limosilactobacillus vaginalis]MDM8243604.1 helix-turn-helix transcriptional regulator [Limosilactobacillus vaginalis]
MLWETVQNQLTKKSMSVYRLSKLTGIPNSTLLSYKNDGVEPTFNNMEKIADALGVSLDEFRGDKGNG